MENKLLIFSILLSIFSCKKIDNKSLAQTQSNIKTLALPISSEKINYNNKDKNGFFIYDKTFDKNQYSHSLSRVYGKYSLSGNLDLVFIERKPNDDGYTEPIITLYSYNKNKKIDSLNIFETINSEATVEKRFLIDQSKKIHIYENSVGYDTTDNGKDTLIVDIRENIYNILESGKFVLQNQKVIAPKNTNNNISKINNDFWNGIYYFEAFNKDNSKTIFDITINSLEDISLNITEEGIKNKYSNIKAEKIDNEKIKINYDSSSDDMGTIYIEKSDDKFYISGNPIYFINPGNNEMPLKKIK